MIAARRSGCKFLIFPESNKKDYDELPDYLKKGLTVNYASSYKDVYKYAFNIRTPSK